MSEFRLSDEVSMRLVQIFQEAMMLRVDGADLLRMVRLEIAVNDPQLLVLTNEYKDRVKEMHRLELEEAERRRLAAFSVGDA